jgi:carboxyl-terminal processing protease
MRFICAALVLLAPAVALAGGDHHSRPTSRSAPEAKKMFEEIAHQIEESYVDGALSEDALWTDAAQGVLDRLIQTQGIKVNTLLDPDQLKELEDGLKGSISGVGLVIKQFEEVVFVRGLIRGGPAAEAGVRTGDRILAVDGKPTKGLTIEAITQMIRGPEGTTVDLKIQRDDGEHVQPLTRRNLKLETVHGGMLPDGVGYLRLGDFSKRTPEQIDQLLSTKLAHATGLVLDLRDSPGGLFDISLEVAERFLPPKARIVVLEGRDKREEVKEAKQKDPADSLPMVVLISKSTASSAEILAAALSDNDRAKLVGEPTLGKGTVERITTLANGWALKLTTARFHSPKGTSWQGKGIEPDFAIARPTPADEDAHWNQADVPELAADPQLKAALAVLKLKSRAR